MDGDGEVDGREWEMVAARPTAAYDVGNDFAVFPPSLHEGLTPTPTLTLDSPSPSSSSASTQNFLDSIDNSKEEEEVGQVSRTPIAESARRLVESGIELFRSKITDLRGRSGCSCNGKAVWSFAAVVGFVGGLMYMRRRHRREKEMLSFLILEKDEVIIVIISIIIYYFTARCLFCFLQILLLKEMGSFYFNGNAPNRKKLSLFSK